MGRIATPAIWNILALYVLYTRQMIMEPGAPPHQLPLKENAIAAIQRNLPVPNGSVRNARARIVTLHRRFIEVQLLDNNTIHYIPRICFSFNAAHCNWTVLQRQFPLRLAYATTFNAGCQGLTLDRTVIDVCTDPFAHDQLYTALSRVRHRSNSLILYSPSNADKDVQNIVYPSLLLE